MATSHFFFRRNPSPSSLPRTPKGKETVQDIRADPPITTLGDCMCARTWKDKKKIFFLPFSSSLPSWEGVFFAWQIFFLLFAHSTLCPCSKGPPGYSGREKRKKKYDSLQQSKHILVGSVVRFQDESSTLKRTHKKTRLAKGKWQTFSALECVPCQSFVICDSIPSDGNGLTGPFLYVAIGTIVKWSSDCRKRVNTSRAQFMLSKCDEWVDVLNECCEWE